MRRRKVFLSDSWAYIHDNGNIERIDPKTGTGIPPSGQWRVTGANRLNNFHQIIEHYSLEDILTRQDIPWRFRNGKQQVFITDFDHGTNRQWGFKHYVAEVILNA